MDVLSCSSSLRCHYHLRLHRSAPSIFLERWREEEASTSTSTLTNASFGYCWQPEDKDHTANGQTNTNPPFVAPHQKGAIWHQHRPIQLRDWNATHQSNRKSVRDTIPINSTQHRKAQRNTSQRVKRNIKKVSKAVQWGNQDQNGAERGREQLVVAAIHFCVFAREKMKVIIISTNGCMMFRHGCCCWYCCCDDGN